MLIAKSDLIVLQICVVCCLLSLKCRRRRGCCCGKKSAVEVPRDKEDGRVGETRQIV